MQKSSIILANQCFVPEHLITRDDLMRWEYRWEERIITDKLDELGNIVFNSKGKPKTTSYVKKHKFNTYEWVIADDGRRWVALPRGNVEKLKPLLRANRKHVIDLRGRSRIDLGLRLKATTMKDKRWPAQKEAVIEWAQHGWGIIHGQTGSGKALANGEPVFTEDGILPIEEVKIGMKVAGSDGRFYAVEGVFPQGRRKLYRITFTDGTHVDCDKDHQWTIDFRRHACRHYKTLTTKDLLRQPLRRSGGNWLFLPTAQSVQWSQRDLPVDPYTLGVLIGDGGLSVES